MTTLAQLADEAQLALSDSGAGTWAQGTVEGWCNAAIREYSRAFPRIVEATFTTSANDRKYDLPAGFQNMVRVEYPDAQSPPEYLQRRDHDGGDFWDNEGYYDIIHHSDASDVDEFWMSENPAASETIRYWYAADHDFALAAGGTVTVPGRHHNILIAFVVWMAFQEILANTHASASATSMTLMQLEINVANAKRDYDALLAAAVANAGRPAARIRWSMDKWDS